MPGGALALLSAYLVYPRKQQAPKPDGFEALDSAIWSGRWESNPLFLSALSRKASLFLGSG